MCKTKENSQDRIFTIPNALSVIRLCLIPLIIWLYCAKQDYAGTTIVLLVSGFTDILDGFIARRFNMISNLGKALDPVADKLTQGVMLICLVSRFPLMGIPLVVLIIKELLNGLFHILVMKKTGVVYGAEWHGKLTTCFLYAMMFLHIIWIEIPAAVSNISIALCIGIMIISMILYICRNLKRIKAEA